jgi:hypothetical protein
MRAFGAGIAGIAALVVGAVAHGQPIRNIAVDEREALITLGTRIHGGFGALIAVGIRIGDDARQRLQSSGRDLTVTYYSGKAASCPCIVDGVMLATYASPGQGSLTVANEPAGDSEFGRVIIAQKTGDRRLEYVIPQSAAAALLAANRGAPLDRWNAIMNLSEGQVYIRREIEPASKEK